MKKLKVIYNIIKPFINKYTIVLIGFGLFMSFGEYSIFNRLRLSHSVDELEKQKTDYQKEIDKAKLDLKQLSTNKSNLERIAREKYNMRKSDEEVFIIKTLDNDSIASEKEKEQEE